LTAFTVSSTEFFRFMDKVIINGWQKIYATFDERQKRLFSAQKSLEIGRGGISEVSRIFSISRTTITKAIKEIETVDFENHPIRKDGGGRKKITSSNKKILNEIESIVSKTSAGDPMTMLKWTCKSTRTISDELNRKGFNISHSTVRSILKEHGYSLQSNKKMLSGKNHPDRDAQFKHIDRSVKRFIKKIQPVISVDTKKKELLGNFKNRGKTGAKEGEATKVLDL